jgi:hypothetical protein
MLGVIMLNVVMLCVVMMNVVTASVVAPSCLTTCCICSVPTGTKLSEFSWMDEIDRESSEIILEKFPSLSMTLRTSKIECFSLVCFCYQTGLLSCTSMAKAIEARGHIHNTSFSL